MTTTFNNNNKKAPIRKGRRALLGSPTFPGLCRQPRDGETEADVEHPYSFKEPVINQHKAFNAWMIDYLEFDTTALDADVEIRAVLPFGISAPFDKAKDPAEVPRRTIDFEIRDPKSIANLLAMDETNKRIAKDNSKAWWRQEKSIEVIEHCYIPMIRQDGSGRWLLRTKGNLWGDNPNSVLKVFNWVTDPKTGKPYTCVSYTDVSAGMPVVGTLKFNGFYIKPENFSMQITCQKLVCFPNDMEDFDFDIPEGMKICEAEKPVEEDTQNDGFDDNGEF